MPQAYTYSFHRPLSITYRYENFRKILNFIFSLKSGASLETFTRYAQISKSTLPCLPERYVSIFFLQYGEVITYLRLWIGSSGSSYRAAPGFFLRRGCTRLLLYFNTNKPHSFFFGRIPVVLENRRSPRGGGVRTPCTLPLDPPLS